jgi:hypothetical protein
LFTEFWIIEKRETGQTECSKLENDRQAAESERESCGQQARERGDRQIATQARGQQTDRQPHRQACRQQLSRPQVDNHTERERRGGAARM